jgi:low affinity Fe/Cu permease
MQIPAFRTWLTQFGVLTARPISFALAGVFVGAWIISTPGEIGWHEIATIATLFMTLLIQRAEHRDTQALHAKLDELLRAEGRARNELAEIDQKDAEEVERDREEARAAPL